MRGKRWGVVCSGDVHTSRHPNLRFILAVSPVGRFYWGLYSHRAGWLNVYSAGNYLDKAIQSYFQVVPKYKVQNAKVCHKRRSAKPVPNRKKHAIKH